MTSRVSVNGMGSSTPGRSIFTCTVLPGLPRRSATAWSTFIVSAAWPSISQNWSPARMPARAPGVPGMGLTTVT